MYCHSWHVTNAEGYKKRRCIRSATHSSFDNRVEFQHNNNIITNLDRNKIVAVNIQTETQIQKHITSSADKAVAGGILGPLGAVIAGRAKPNSNIECQYLIFTYTNNNTLSIIAFEL